MSFSFGSEGAPVVIIGQKGMVGGAFGRDKETGLAESSRDMVNWRRLVVEGVGCIGCNANG